MMSEWRDSDPMEDALNMANDAIRSGGLECIGGPRDGERIVLVNPRVGEDFSLANRYDGFYRVRQHSERLVLVWIYTGGKSCDSRPDHRQEAQ
jgi:hypothetical protein